MTLTCTLPVQPTNKSTHQPTHQPKPTELRAIQADPPPESTRRAGYDEARVSTLLHGVANSETDHERTVTRSALIGELVPFAHHLAHRFRHRGEPLDDLRQVAVIGLIKAIDRFEPGHDTTFAAYAVPTIRGELRRHFRDKGWMVRVPRSLQERRAEINTMTEKLTHRLGRTPTIGDLAEALYTSTEEICRGLQAATAYAATSLERPLGESGRTVGDTLAGEDGGLELAELRLALRQVLAELPERERRILGLRYVNQLPQTEIAAELEISQMHVSRLLRRALDTLRSHLCSERPGDPGSTSPAGRNQYPARSLASAAAG